MPAVTEYIHSYKTDFKILISHDKFIAKGSAGEVYGPLIWENKRCAIKKRLFNYRSLTKKTEKEIKACDKWRSLRHPNLLKVFEVNFEVNVLHIVMEYAEGGSLTDVLKSLPSDVPYDIFQNWAAQIAKGMDYLHGSSIVHRDLKSPNIVIMEGILNSDVRGKTLKITDFDQIKEHDHTTTMSGAGTYAWMAPEVITSNHFSKASDVWSFGVILWEILTRKLPHEGMDGVAIAVKVGAGKLKLDVPNSCPSFLKRLLQRCWNYDTKERPSFTEIPAAIENRRQLTNDEIRRCVQRIQRKIVSDVDPDVLSDWLMQQNIITAGHCQTNRAKNSIRSSRCRSLLLDLYSNSNPNTFLVVLDALQEEAPHIYDSIVNQTSSDGNSALCNSCHATSPTQTIDRSPCDSETKFKKLFCQQKSLDETCSDLRKQLETEKESHRKEKEEMDRARKEEKRARKEEKRAWKEEKSQLLQKQDQLERRISELEELHQMGKRRKSSDGKEKEHSTSIDRTEKEITGTSGAELEAPEQIHRIDSSPFRQAQEFFLKHGSAEASSTERKPQISHQDCRMNGSTWKRNSDKQTTRDSNTASNEISPKSIQDLVMTWMSLPLPNREEKPEEKCSSVSHLFNRQKTSQPPFAEPQAAPTSLTQNSNNERDSVSHQMTIRTRAATDENKAITGLTILGRELFVVSRLSSEVEVYDSTALTFCRRWESSELDSSVDMASCKKKKCLYIIHERGSGQTTEILSVDINGALRTKWSTGSDHGYSISVTDESNVVISVFHSNKLIEYSSDGQLVREVRLTAESSLEHPSHALKLTSGQFLVCQGTRNDSLHRVCIVDSDGRLVKSSNGRNGSIGIGMNRPVHLAVDGNGTWMVVDQWNSRVLSLDSNLGCKREVLSKEGHGLRRPSRILLDESNGRLLVADNEWDTKNLILVDGRILSFNYKF